MHLEALVDDQLTVMLPLYSTLVNLLLSATVGVLDVSGERSLLPAWPQPVKKITGIKIDNKIFFEKSNIGNHLTY